MRKSPTVEAIFVGCLLAGIAAAARADIPVFEPGLTLESLQDLPDYGSANYTPAAATDGSGTWVVAWSSNDPLSGMDTGDFDIHFARSTDHGLTFTARAPLNADASTDVSYYIDHSIEVNDLDASIAADASGTFIAVWLRSSILIGTLLEFARSDDAGVTWTPNVVLTDHARDPKIATDGAGNWIVVWMFSPVVSDDRIYFTRSSDDGVTWSPPAKLNAGTVDAGSPSIAWAGGVWVVAWSTRRPDPLTPFDSDVFVTRSTNGGGSWSPPSALNVMADSDEAEDRSPVVASDGAGNWVVAWVRSASAAMISVETDILFVHSSDGAATWSTPQKLNSGTDAVLRWDPHVAADPSGTFVAAWTRHSPDDASGYPYDDNVTMAASTGGAAWSPETRLGNAPAETQRGRDIQPFVAHDPAGYWMALWSSGDLRLTSGTKDRDFIAMALAGHPCGNGLPDGTEECDTGHRGALECCTRVCTLEPADTACAADAELCTLERCDGAGTCNHLPVAAGVHCTPDSDLCTFDRCNGASTCEHVVAPRDDCKKPLKSGVAKLEMESDGTAEGSRVEWKWSHGEPTIERDIVFQIGAYDYAFCMYDPTGLIARVDAPNYADCFTDGGKKDCWKYLDRRGLQYSVREAIPNGMSKLMVTTNANANGKIKMRGQGANLDLPILPVAGFPLTVQLVNDKEACWEATYSTSPPQNTSTGFSAGND